MTLKTDVQSAKDAVSKALVTALNAKNETVVSQLISAYNTISDIKVETNTFSISTGNTVYDFMGAGQPVASSYGNDVISFS